MTITTMTNNRVVPPCSSPRVAVRVGIGTEDADDDDDNPHRSNNTPSWK